MIASPCETCRGQGAVEKQRKVLVNVPAGIDSEQRRRRPRPRHARPPNAPAGDLYVDIEVAGSREHSSGTATTWATRLTLSFAEASLGTTTKLVLPDEREVTVKVDAGCPTRQRRQSCRGEGVPRLDSRRPRDLHVMVGVKVPKKLSKKREAPAAKSSSKS
jgi:molecular chaperone DnaJ